MKKVLILSLSILSVIAVITIIVYSINNYNNNKDSKHNEKVETLFLEYGYNPLVYYNDLKEYQNYLEDYQLCAVREDHNEFQYYCNYILTDNADYYFEISSDKELIYASAVNSEKPKRTCKLGENFEVLEACSIDDALLQEYEQELTKLVYKINLVRNDVEEIKVKLGVD